MSNARNLARLLPNASGQLPDAAMASGSVLQAVSTTFTGLFASASGTPTDVPGFAATITPISASSKILITLSVCFGFNDDAYPYVLLARNGISIGTGASASGSQINSFLSGTGTAAPSSTPWRYHQPCRQHLDAPNTTGNVTYQVKFAAPYNGYTAYINRQSSQADAVYVQYPASTITLMEIAA